MSMLNNSICASKDKIHLINEQVVFAKGVDLYENEFFPKLKTILVANNYKFRLTDEKKSTKVVPQTLLSQVSYKNLPLVYCGKDEDDGRIYVGEKWGNTNVRKSEGSSTHDVTKKTALSEFAKKKYNSSLPIQPPKY